MSFRPKRILRLQMIIKPPERWFRGLIAFAPLLLCLQKTYE